MPFLSRSVFDHRFTYMLALMDRENLEALAFTSEDFVTFGTNFTLDVRVFERPVAAVIKKDGTVFTFFNQLSSNHYKMSKERHQCWIDDALFYDEFPEGTNSGRLLTNWQETFAALLGKHGLGAARIGVENAGGPLQNVNRFLPELSLVNVGADMKLLRAVKHEEEIDLMARACKLTEWMQDAYVANIAPGRFIQELDAEMHLLGYQKAQKLFEGDELIFRGYTLSGPASASPHGNGARTGAVINAGDVVVNMIIPVINGLVVENERTYFCGEPGEKQREAYTAALAANQAAIQEIRTGNRVCEIENAARKQIISAGFAGHLCHRTGHGLGLLGHEWPVDMAFCDRVLMKNEVYSAEPGIYVYGLGGFRIDDTVVVDTEPKVLTRSPKELEDIIIK